MTLTITQIVRECLLLLDDPDVIDINRLVVTVRSRYQNNGGNSDKVTRQGIVSSLNKLKRAIGEPLTKTNITKYHEYVKTYKQENARKCNKTRKPDLVKKETSYTSNMLKEGKQFITNCGNITNARNLLTLLEELTK